MSQLTRLFKHFFNFKHSLTKFFAFTLAETLIVIGIIGIVASLTIPNLNSTTADKEKITKVKKSYALLNEAFERAQAVYGPFDEWYGSSGFDTSDEERIITRIVEFMKVSQNCEYSTDKGCFSAGRVFKDFRTNDEVIMGEAIDTMDTAYKFVLADGSSMAFFNAYSLFLAVNIDPKASPIFGKNVFLFILYSNALYAPDDIGVGENICGTQDACISPKIPSAFGIENYADWIIQHGNMDYLKTDTSGKCNDSNIVLDGTTNTSCK